VEMHKAVKQGCPLAPLLFIIVMDELHASLASSTGYSLGPPNADSPSGVVKSREVTATTRASFPTRIKASAK
jgi:hypothetical protein